MYLSIRKSYCRGCDGFSYIEDQKSHRISMHINNNTPLQPKFFSSNINKKFLPNLLFTANFLSIIEFYPKLILQS